jgi:hypothetical protein
MRQYGMEEGMLAELDVVVFIKSSEPFDAAAARVFAVLRSPFEATSDDAGTITGYEGSGLGFHALFFANEGDTLDPEFEAYHYGLEISSLFWCVEMDGLNLSDDLSEYFARQLAFELNAETATEVLLETTEESEIFEIRAYRRNPQYRLDQSPTTPRVFVIETRQVEADFDEEVGEWDEEEDEGDLEAEELADEEHADEEEMVGDLEREDL